MFNFFKRPKAQDTQTSISTALNKTQLIHEFYSRPDHQWILEDKYIKSNFDEFFEYVPTALMRQIVVDYRIVFVPITGKFSCAISGANVVLVFPELHELLASTALSYYKAILAHEVGHIVCAHGSKTLSIIEAQVEADELAIDLGFEKDLEDFLLDQPESIEKRVRLSYLTSRYYKNQLEAEF